MHIIVPDNKPIQQTITTLGRAGLDAIAARGDAVLIVTFSLD